MNRVSIDRYPSWTSLAHKLLIILHRNGFMLLSVNGLHLSTISTSQAESLGEVDIVERVYRCVGNFISVDDVTTLTCAFNK